MFKTATQSIRESVNRPPGTVREAFPMEFDPTSYRDLRNTSTTSTAPLPVHPTDFPPPETYCNDDLLGWHGAHPVTANVYNIMPEPYPKVTSAHPTCADYFQKTNDEVAMLPIAARPVAQLNSQVLGHGTLDNCDDAWPFPPPTSGVSWDTCGCSSRPVQPLVPFGVDQELPADFLANKHWEPYSEAEIQY